MWKNWSVFIETVETKKNEKLLRRQRSQYEYHRQKVNTTSYICDGVELHLTPGTESWHFREMKPQRESFIKHYVAIQQVMQPT